jgi:transcriptional regulator with XRE-family HTH domain
MATTLIVQMKTVRTDCVEGSADVTKRIGDRLDSAMKRAGFSSQAALGRAAGVPQPTVNRILKGVVGKRGPETETLKRLARACGVSFAWLNEGRPSDDAPAQHLTAAQREWLMLLEGLCSADIEEFTVLINARRSRNQLVIAELASNS